MAPRLTAAQVRELVAGVAPELAGVDVREVEVGGTTSRVFRVGDDHAARFREDVDEGSLAHEHAAMAAFASVSPFHSPRPAAIGPAGAHWPWPWSLRTWVAGDVATAGGLAESVSFADDLVELITATRRLDAGGRVHEGSGRGGRLRDHDAWVHECLRRSVGLLPAPELGALWARLRDQPRGALPDVMSHTDLIPANLLVRDDRLVGVLDTGGLGPADPALDLVAAWHLLDADRHDHVRRRLDVDDATWSRGAAWAFEQAIGLVWFYEVSHPTMAALGRSTLTRLLESDL